MNDIKFNCPQCGQHLTVGTSAAGATVACPKCGQTILVPTLARVTSALPPGQSPARAKWPWVAAGIVGIALLVPR